MYIITVYVDYTSDYFIPLKTVDSPTNRLPINLLWYKTQIGRWLVRLLNGCPHKGRCLWPGVMHVHCIVSQYKKKGNKYE